MTRYEYDHGQPASLGVSRELLVLGVAMRQRTSRQDSVGLKTSCLFSLGFSHLSHLEFAGRGCADNGADKYCEKVSNSSVKMSQWILSYHLFHS